MFTKTKYVLYIKISLFHIIADLVLCIKSRMMKTERNLLMRKAFCILFIIIFVLNCLSIYTLAAEQIIYGVAAADENLVILGRTTLLMRQPVSLVIRSDDNEEPLSAVGGTAYADQQKTDLNGWFCFKVRLGNFNQNDVLGIHIMGFIGLQNQDVKYISLPEVLGEEEVNVMDFGADNTGTIDNTFLLTMLHETGKKIYYPAGTYRFNGDNLDLSGGVRFESRDSVTVRNNVSPVNILNFDDKGNLIGLMHNHLEKSNDDLGGGKNTIGNLVRPPLSNADYKTKVDFIPYWYNDFGLESARQSSYGSKVWYDWRWNFHKNGGSDPKTAYDPERQPLLGFYRGDDPIVLDWQCYWLKEYGAKAVVLYSSRKDSSITQNWHLSSSSDHWIYQLFHNVPNFNTLEYIMTLSANYPAVDGTTEELKNTVRQVWHQTLDDIYGVYQKPYCIVEGGKKYPVVYVHEEGAVFGVFDNYSGTGNTLNFYKTLVDKMKSFGYDGIALFVRNEPSMSKSAEQAFESAGIKRIKVEYSPRYIDTKNETASYEYLVESFNPPVDGKTAVNTFTSRYTHNPHPSTWSTPGQTPALFNKLLNKAIDHVYRNNMPKIITCYNISEWAEGGPGLQPNVKNRFGYLQALKDAIVQNDTGDTILNITYINESGNVVSGENDLPKNGSLLIRYTLYSSRPVSGQLAVALYKEGLLYDVKLNPISKQAGTLNWEVALQAANLEEISHIKTFLVDSTQRLEPLVGSRAFPNTATYLRKD